MQEILSKMKLPANTGYRDGSIYRNYRDKSNVADIDNIDISYLIGDFNISFRYIVSYRCQMKYRPFFDNFAYFFYIIEQLRLVCGSIISKKSQFNNMNNENLDI